MLSNDIRMVDRKYVTRAISSCLIMLKLNRDFFQNRPQTIKDLLSVCHGQLDFNENARNKVKIEKKYKIG